jgi:hypothetical protein
MMHMIMIISQAFKEPDSSQETTTCNNTKQQGDTESSYNKVLSKEKPKISSINEKLDHTTKIQISNKVQQRIPPNKPGGDSQHKHQEIQAKTSYFQE